MKKVKEMNWTECYKMIQSYDINMMILKHNIEKYKILKKHKTLNNTT